MNEINQLTAAPQLKTPRAAAVAGIIFALLLGTGQTLLQLAVPTAISTNSTAVSGQINMVSFALKLMPFAGIAFLWFIGVVRDRIGQAEDHFFSTVFLGSGLLYLGLSFVSAALADGLLTSYEMNPAQTKATVYTFGRLAMYQMSTTYALRMSGVFMISLATIWVQTRKMPLWLALATYALALLLLLGINLSAWFTLIFPAWVFVISLYILIGNLRNTDAQVQKPDARAQRPQESPGI